MSSYSSDGRLGIAGGFVAKPMPAAVERAANVSARAGEIIRYRAINRWDENDEFDEWAKPSRPLSAEAERILGVTNEQVAHCRSADEVLEDFLEFIDVI